MKETYKLDKNELFATPKSPEELFKYVKMFNGSERIVALTVMNMTWNLCAELTKKAAKKKKN
jgi:hypothetical protein